MLMVSSMTQLWMSLGARARAREREREREKSDGSKISLEQKEEKTERDRETEISERERERARDGKRGRQRKRERKRERAIDRAVYGDVRSAMCRTIHTAMDRTLVAAGTAIAIATLRSRFANRCDSGIAARYRS